MVIHEGQPNPDASEILARWKLRLAEANTRRVFAAVLAAKLVAAILVIGIIKSVNWYLATPAWADEAQVPAHINALNTMWTLIAAFLVFFMQAGFMCLEA